MQFPFADALGCCGLVMMPLAPGRHWMESSRSFIISSIFILGTLSLTISTDDSVLDIGWKIGAQEKCFICLTDTL